MLLVSLENLTITITGTNTTGTGTLTLSQDAAYCVPIGVTCKSVSESTHSFNDWSPRVTISGTTVTVTRNAGNDLGTITYEVSIAEFDSTDNTVETGTGTIGSGSSTETVNLVSPVTDLAASALFFGNGSTNTGDLFSNSMCTGEFVDVNDLIFTRVGTSSTTPTRWYVVENLVGDWIVDHASATIASTDESAEANLSITVNMDKTFIVCSQRGTSTNDWRDCVARAELTSDGVVTLTRGNSGAAGANTLPCVVQAIELQGGQTVYRGTITITGTSATDTFSGVSDVDGATIRTPMIHGYGEGNSTAGGDLGSAHAAMRLTAPDTAEGSIVTDVTPDGFFSYEVIDWDLGGGGGVEYDRSASSTVALTESSTRQAEFSRAGSETVALNEGTTRQAEFSRAAQDTVALNEGATRQAEFARAAQDTVALNEAADRLVEFLRSASSTIFLNHSGSASVSTTEDFDRSASDTIALSETSAAIIVVPGMVVVIDENTDCYLVVLTEEEIVTITKIWNIALSSVGLPTVNSTSDPGPSTALLQSLWESFRQQFLMDHPWNGAVTRRTLTRLQYLGAEVLPEGSSAYRTWRHAYELPGPADPRPYLSALYINGHPNVPRANQEWAIEVVKDDGDNLHRCMVSNHTIIELEYIFDVQDSGIGLLSPLTAQAMGLALGVQIMPSRTTPTERAAIIARAEQAMAAAKSVDGKESSPRRFSNHPLIDVRESDC